MVNRALVGGLNWSRTPAFRLSSGGEGLVRLNIKGREAQGFFEPNIGNAVQRILDSPQNRHTERIGQVEHHHAQRVVSAAAQRARQLVRTVSQPFSCLLDLFLGLRRDIAGQRGLVQDNGNRRSRESALARHVANSRGVSFGFT